MRSSALSGSCSGCRTPLRGLCAASARGNLRRFGARGFAPLRRGEICAASAREYLRRGSAGGECACGARRFVLARLHAGMRLGRRRFVLARLHAGMRLGRRRAMLGKKYAPARGGALNLFSSCAIGASALGHTMSLHCEGTPSWERGKNKIRQKRGLPPLPVGFSLALLFPSTLSPFPRFSCGCVGFALRLVRCGRVGGALFVGLHYYRAEG